MFNLIKKTKTLFNIIDSITETKNTIYIKTNKDIVIEHQGHIITINKGYNITLAKEIHLNPNINLNKDLSNIETEISKTKRINYEK